MDIKTFRAKTMQEALALVRRELGPDASVLHTRELNGGLVRPDAVRAAVRGGRVGRRERAEPACRRGCRSAGGSEQPASQRLDARRMPRADYRSQYRDDFRHQVAGQLDRLQAMIEKLCSQPAPAPRHDLPESLFHVFTDMIEAEVDEAIARDLVDRDSRRQRHRTWPTRCW